MSRFIKITVTGDLSHLGRCKDPESLWETIHSEYTELSGDEVSTQGFILAKQINYLKNRIKITNSIIYYLSIRGVVPELIAELNDMGYRVKGVNLENDIQRVIGLSKSDHVKLAAANDAYAKLPKGEETTARVWYQMLSALAKHRGVVVINPSLISVMEYCVMDREYREYIIAMTPKANR